VVVGWKDNFSKPPIPFITPFFGAFVLRMGALPLFPRFLSFSRFSFVIVLLLFVFCVSLLCCEDGLNVHYFL
jgi:hypothetical protein